MSDAVAAPIISRNFLAAGSRLPAKPNEADRASSCKFIGAPSATSSLRASSITKRSDQCINGCDRAEIRRRDSGLGDTDIEFRFDGQNEVHHVERGQADLA